MPQNNKKSAIISKKKVRYCKDNEGTNRMEGSTRQRWRYLFEGIVLEYFTHETPLLIAL